MNIKTTRLTNPNGELLSEQISKYKSVFEDDEGYLFWNKKDYTKSFQDVEYPKELTDSELGKITRLTKKVYADTNMIAYRGNGGRIKAYTDEQISGYLELGLRQGRRFLTKMNKLGIIIKHNNKGTTEYYFNPLYYFSNNRINLDLYLICKEQLDKVLQAWVIERYMLLVDED